MKRALYFAPLALFTAVALWFAAGLGRNPDYIPSMLINRPVPDFALPPIAGREGARVAGLSSADLRGEVALVNVFASWCISCEVEHPVLMAIAKEGAVPLMGLDWKDRPGDGAAWLARKGDPYARIGDDQSGRVAIDFGVTGAPETFVIDRKGRVRHKHVGPISREDWRDVLRPMIEDLKNEASGSPVGDGVDRGDGVAGGRSG